MKGRFYILLTGFFCVFLISPLSHAQTAPGGQDCERWDNGNKRECKEYAPNGAFTQTYYREDGTLQQMERYDAEGNKTEESYYDGGRLAQNPVANWAAMRWKYQDGAMVEESYYDTTGRLTQRNFYDPSGNRVDRQFVGDGRANEADAFGPTVLGEETNQFYSEDGRMKYETSALVE